MTENLISKSRQSNKVRAAMATRVTSPARHAGNGVTYFYERRRVGRSQGRRKHRHMAADVAACIQRRPVFTDRESVTTAFSRTPIVNVRACTLAAVLMPNSPSVSALLRPNR